MKRLCTLLVLLVTASSAQADSISFSVAGHRIRVDAPRNCRSASCASISIPGIYESRRKKWDDEDRDVVAAPPPPATAPAPPVQQAPPPAPIPSPAQQVTPPAAPANVATPAPASRLTVVMVPAPMPLAVYKPAATATQEVAPPPPAARPPVIKPADMKPAAPLLNVLREDDQPDSPIGDWQTESKGMVRIAECGRALCGYSIKAGRR